MPQSIQVFSESQKNLPINFVRKGTLKSAQFLKLNSAFSDVEPYICLEPLILDDIYLNSDSNSEGIINIYVNNSIVKTFNFTRETKNIESGINLATNDTISVQCVANPLVNNVNVTLILEYA